MFLTYKNMFPVRIQRNIGRFPEDFCFKLTNEEYFILKSQIATSNIDNKELYHCWASLKDLGKKCFGINKIEVIDFIENINKIINF